ncbi:MAG: NUDIX hydrolase [Chloroflexi bacterium]|nr:NUDIX hydrolase [Chloroflexota bacterium]
MTQRIRCGVLVVRDGRLLMFRGDDPEIGEHRRPPGGELEGPESIWDCAAREFVEETGAQARNLRLVYIQQFTTREANQATFMFLSEDLDGIPAVPGAENSAGERIHELDWLSENELSGKRVIPPFIAERLFTDYRNGFPSPIYVSARKST